MSTDDSPQEATEAAVAELLRLTFLWIRAMSAQPTEGQSTEELIKLHDQIHDLADICHNLPALLMPSRRHNLMAGLRYQWGVSAQRERDWMTACWDRVGYDYAWLSDLEAEQPAARTDNGAAGE
ncbi:hypothetical protein [Micromonospora sp. DT227]|uniref:hypothetical protein n=1 Tax=Micromonospora sp. DT227 TaxID=3393433 RepID=UPI003CFB57B4